MAGTITYQPNGSASIATNAIPIRVFLYDSEETGTAAYTLLPNIRCEQIQYKEGADPPSARFSYILDAIAANMNGWPDDFGDIWPLYGVADSNYVVAMDDQLVVLAMLPSGSTRVLFNGFARVPQVDLAPRSQSVTFSATGVAIRCWDKPIGSRPQRDASDPFDGNVINVDLPWRFNPAGDGPDSIGGVVPNCTPDGYDVDQDGDLPYPVFLDSIANTNAPNLDSGGGDSGEPVLWDLSRATRAILAVYNSSTFGSLVQNPWFDNLQAILQNRQPLPGSSFFDPDDPSTYTTEENVIRDYDATNKAWPDVLSALFEYHGFAMRWITKTGSSGTPVDTFEVYRKDDSNPIAPKLVYLANPGTSIASSSPSNVAAFHGGFDFHGVANQVHLDTHPTRYEVSFILAPGFVPASNDGMAASRTQFLQSALDAATATQGLRDKYRLWIADEIGAGFYAYDNPEPAWTAGQPLDLTPVIPVTKKGDYLYVDRYRKPDGTLLTKDYLNKPYKTRLQISRNYGYIANGAESDYSPCVYGSAGFASTSVTWQDVSPGTWDLLPDRIGVRITCENVEEWNVGKPKAGMATGASGTPQYWPVPGGKLQGITSIASPKTFDPATTTYTTEPYWLRLTCVIDGDQDLHVVARRRDASPLADVVRRRVDCRDHFLKEVIDVSSPFNIPAGQNPPAPIVQRDDTVNAQAFADQVRTAHELPSLAASITIPMLVNYIKVGDRISEIDGRDVSFRNNAGSEQLEGPSYPFVVGVTWSFEGDHQSTVIQLSDRRHEPASPRGNG